MRNEGADPRVDAGLAEIVGGSEPPDLRDAIHARLASGAGVGTLPLDARRPHVRRTRLIAAALLVLGTAVVTALAVLEGEPAEYASTAAVPDEHRAFASGLAALRALPEDVVALTVTGIEPSQLGELVRFRELQDLDLRVPVDDRDLARLAGLVKLRRLALIGNQAIDGTGFAPLDVLPVLEHLDVSGTTVDAAGLRAIAKLPALTWLNLYLCRKLDDDAMDVLAGMRGLRVLNVSWCHGVSKQGFLQLAALTGLRELYLAHDDSGRRSSTWPLPGDADGIGVDDEVLRALGSLGRLRVLSLGRCFSLTADCVPALERFSELEDLDLTALDFAVAAIARSPATLQSLVLDFCDVGNADVKRVAERFPLLERLDLSNCQRVGAGGLAALVGLRHLRHLALRGHDDAGAFAAAVPLLRGLRVLELQGVRGIDRPVVDAIAALPQLEELHLGGSDEFDAGLLARLAAAPALRRLHLGSHGERTLDGLRALGALRLEVLDLRPSGNIRLPVPARSTIEPDALLRVVRELWPGCRVVLPDGAVVDVGR